jgi:hypothetical protein
LLIPHQVFIKTQTRPVESRDAKPISSKPMAPVGVAPGRRADKPTCFNQAPAKKRNAAVTKLFRTIFSNIKFKFYFGCQQWVLRRDTAGRRVTPPCSKERKMMKKLGFDWYNSICCAKDANIFLNYIIQLFQDDEKNGKIRYFSMNNFLICILQNANCILHIYELHSRSISCSAAIINVHAFFE